MFRRMHQPSAEKTVVIDFEGQALHVGAHETVAAALLAAGVGYTRTTAKEGQRRAPYCQMGVCFECLVEIDGVPNQQACLVRVRKGMKIRRQYGLRQLPLMPTALTNAGPEDSGSVQTITEDI